MIAVVGPSGAGKDTLIDYARQRLSTDPSILFVRRVVTRIAQANAEDHDTLTVESFAEERTAGKFAVTWQAHGLHYAIPSDARLHVVSGGIAVVNGSRAALPAICSAFGRVLTVLVTCRPDVLAARLAARGRENALEQGLRLARGAMPSDKLSPAIEIDNSDGVAVAGNALVAIIHDAIGVDQSGHMLRP
ncbi:phosphonate metabolism protein/1,5-bisphosphokinase (PRPP-forming) PhnN [Mesorhizobium sp. LHD-90]|uniref:phosphonate metabolism protein/1,5-bisphosphokinase (PRPP-forming) PhnN n=1 Tax=Mesorhizobium sp. LHD-90 TaxID=3071414 RepID=UPI0027E121EF|nr:phosphonate metabolism protein/1,5-bisphosphokinase (PRPP-forming) PhnN [Mesorhizobium sp. LHD-90]MDQ6434606.1 phosphonate metabolism protein/1,5-bisphosphokinase (PRPP-forming) PhnN [Mesorhizobium sp. LHD-90]